MFPQRLEQSLESLHMSQGKRERKSTCKILRVPLLFCRSISLWVKADNNTVPEVNQNEIVATRLLCRRQKYRVYTVQVSFFKKEAKRGQHHYFQIVYRL